MTKTSKPTCVDIKRKIAELEARLASTYHFAVTYKPEGADD